MNVERSLDVRNHIVMNYGGDASRYSYKKIN